MKNPAVDKWKKLALSLAIIIVLNIFFNVGVNTFYEEPDYQDFCTETSEDGETPVNEDACIAGGGTWNISENRNYCENFDKTCSGSDWTEARSDYSRNVFVILVTLGAATLLLGIFLNLPMSVMNGLLYGGILSMVIGTMRYWPEMEDYLRFIVSGVILVLLIVIGLKKVKD